MLPKIKMRVEDVFSDDPPPNYVYAAIHGESIRFHSTRGMSRRSLETIYGKAAVMQVLDIP